MANKHKNLSEAAQDILQKNVGEKQASGEQFGVDKGNYPTGFQDLGLSGTHVNDPAYRAQDGVGQALPPGATPPVGSEPIKVNPTQIQQVAGRPDLLADPETQVDQNYDELRDRIMGKPSKTQQPINPGAMPPYAPGIGMTVPESNETYCKDIVKQVLEGNKESFKEDITAMLSGETLDEVFTSKAQLIFESAVNSRVEEIATILEEKLIEEFTEQVKEIKEEFSDKVDEYLDYVVNEWITDNEIAIEQGLKNEIMEDFISSLKSVFEEHYIDIPDEKVNVVEQLTDKVSSLESDLNEQIEKNVKLYKQLSESNKDKIVNSICEGLILTQAEKIKSLAKGVEFISESDYKEKINIIKENYFPTGKPSNTLIEETYTPEETKKVNESSNPNMQKYKEILKNSR